MSYTYVQSNGTNTGNSASARAVAFGSNVSVGDLIVVAVSQYFDGTQTITDTLGNTYTSLPMGQIISPVDSNARGEMFYTISGGSGANTVTVTPSKSCYMSVAIAEYSGNASSSVYDSQNHASATSASPSSGTVTISNTGSLLVGMTFSANNSFSSSAGTGFTQRYTSNTNEPLSYEDGVFNTDTAATFTQGINGWTCIAASFKPTATSSGTQVAWVS